MRMVGMLLVVVLGSAPVVALADGQRRVTRCCLELELPGVPPGPLCVQLHGRRGLGPRLACRLLGGQPIGRGDCSPAACREPVPGAPFAGAGLGR
jgi:hypothetical protein